MAYFSPDDNTDFDGRIKTAYIESSESLNNIYVDIIGARLVVMLNLAAIALSVMDKLEGIADVED